MTSHAPDVCCSVGVKHEGQPTGEIKNIGDIPTYFVYPKDKSTANAILILTDIIGHVAVNVQLIADQLAANGYFVVIPDLFHGDPVELGSMSSGKISLQDWLKNHGTETVDPVIQTVLKELRGPLGAKKIGSIGYCFGAKYVVRFLKDGHLDAGFVAHPSFVSPEELRAITGPLSIAAAETDDIFPADKRHETEHILKEELSVPYQLTLYSGVQHGFAVRGDLSNKLFKFAKEQAFLQAVTWFNEYAKA